ncbi:MAG: hypothetical protein LBS05_05915 [Tannerellaceae bacterium]|jgi:hypothetical protein|nr:hypothetical protein [Tannerellaceae bacterium]
MNKNPKIHPLGLLLLVTGLMFSAWGQGQAQQASLAGTWTVRQVTMQQTVDNKTSFQTFSGTSSLQSFVERPRVIVITADSLTFRYDKRSEAGPYRVEGNRLAVQLVTQPCEYAWQINANGELILNRTVNYVINDQTTRKVKDEYIIYARK